MGVVTICLTLLILCLCFAFYRSRKRNMKIFEQMKVPGPTPNFLFGNLFALLTKQGFYEIYNEWYQKYGKTFGYFEGPKPVLVTADLDILHQVFVKKFRSFHSRKVFPVQVDPETDPEVHMFFAKGERWKRLRSITNPAFSTYKMRKMSPFIHSCTDNVINILNEAANKGKDVEIYDVFQRLTLDTIARCGFGTRTEALNDPNDKFLSHCRSVLRDTTKKSFLFLLGFLFPKLNKFWIQLYNLHGKLFNNPVFWLENSLDNVIKIQKESLPNSQVNLVYLMLIAQRHPTKIQSNLDVQKLSESEDTTSQAQGTYKSLSSEEIRSQSLLFLLAGYETTSTTLAYLAYELAANPGVQRRLQDEIDSYLAGKDDQPDFDMARNLEYMDMVWCETLRKYPLASTVIARECQETCQVENLTIPKNMIVQANVWAVHYNTDIWGPNPEQFIPDRFLPEVRKRRHCMAFMPFGGGPRKCIGLRFARLESKLTIIKILNKFDLSPAERQGPLEIVEGATITPKNGVYVTLRHRRKP